MGRLGSEVLVSTSFQIFSSAALGGKGNRPEGGGIYLKGAMFRGNVLHFLILCMPAGAGARTACGRTR